MTQRTCRLCPAPVDALDLCRKHYSRQYRHGDPLHGENALPWATPGVYSITCLANGWVYIGSTLSFRSRWKTHKSHLNTGRHNIPQLQADWDEHGEDAFACEVVTVVADRDERFAAEQVHIDSAMATGKCYNLSPSAKNNGGHRFSPEQRQRVSDGLKGKPKSAGHRANLWRDREVTPEFREQMAANGRVSGGKPKSAETRAKMSARQKGSGNPAAKLDEGKVRDIKRRLAAGEGGSAIARAFGVSPAIITNIKKGDRWAHVTVDEPVPVPASPAPLPSGDQMSMFT